MINGNYNVKQQNTFNIENVNFRNTTNIIIKVRINNIIDISNFPDGVYILQVTYDNDTKDVIRFIVKN